MLPRKATSASSFFSVGVRPLRVGQLLNISRDRPALASRIHPGRAAQFQPKGFRSCGGGLALLRAGLGCVPPHAQRHAPSPAGFAAHVQVPERGDDAPMVSELGKRRPCQRPHQVEHRHFSCWDLLLPVVPAVQVRVEGVAGELELLPRRPSPALLSLQVWPTDSEGGT